MDTHFNPKDNGDALLSSIKAVVIGSPGHYREKMFDHMKETAEKKKSPLFKELISKAILTHCSSGFKHSLNEIMQNKEIKEKISDLACFSESKQLEVFFETLRTADDKVCYGFNSVKYALDYGAIETLLISDHLFRAKNTSIRK